MNKNICIKPLSQNGFTLIELVIVFAIIAIAATLAIPRIGDSIARRDLDNAARQLAADLRWMQQLTINSGGGAIPRMTFAASSPYKYYVTVSTQNVKSVTIPTTVSVINTIVSFDINGLPDLPNCLGITITLNSTEIPGLSKQVIIDSVGRVRVGGT